MKTIVFVCSGNTCRSPMAEAIARHLLARESVAKGSEDGPAPVEVLVRSAGIAAGPGEPAAPEGREALRRLGIEMGRHASKPLTRRMIQDADEVLTMTASHARAVAAMEPDAAAKVSTIDPAGDVPDPIGGPQPVYDETARVLLDLIRERLRAASLIA
ncbi:MAG: low molecular weight protein arginine phosphatase [Phycisphaerales bacterium]|nr:low molecular weight protein arginine phosphatase [Phycisphaerales bacterium]